MDEKPNCFKVLRKSPRGVLSSLYIDGENAITYFEGKEIFGIENTPIFAYRDKTEAISIAQSFFSNINTVVYSAIGRVKVKRPPYLLKIGYANHHHDEFIEYWKNPESLGRTFHTHFLSFTVLYNSITLVEKIYERY